MLLLFLFLPYKRLWNRYKIKLKGFISLYTKSRKKGKKEAVSEMSHFYLGSKEEGALRTQAQAQLPFVHVLIQYI